MSIKLRIIGSGVLFLLTIGVGIWLSNSGKPYNTGIFTIHKVISLVTVIFVGILITKLLKNGEHKSIKIALVIIAGLSILALFVTGALLSIGSAPYVLMKTIHIVATILVISTTVVVIKYLVGSNIS